MAESRTRRCRGGQGSLVGLLLTGLLLAAAARAADLDSSCTVSIQNRTVRAQADGTWIIANAPANVGQVRARATCVGDGLTRSGQSEFFVVPADGSITLPPITLDSLSPVPATIVVTPSELDLASVGQSAQLAVWATYPNQSQSDVSAMTDGTSYVSSNPGIATVSADGLVTANGSGTALVSVTNEGVLAVARVRVALSGEDADGDGIPDDVELANGLNPNDPTDALEDPDVDGLNNKEELIDFGTDFQDPDSDGDTIEDGEETIAGDDGFVTNPLLADTDGDGIRDQLEIDTGSDPTDAASFDLDAALASFDVSPSVFVLTFNTIEGEASRQLSVTGNLIDGTTIDLTSAARGTNYVSNDLAVCNFGGTDGEVFAGIAGSCTVSVTNASFSADVIGVVRIFAPTSRGFVGMPGFANNVEVDGPLAFVAAGSAGIQVVDVADPAAPTVVGGFDTSGNANDVAVVGSLAYVADGPAGLKILDLTDPLNPSLLGSLATVGDAWSVAVEGGVAAVAAGAGGFELVDVGDPMLPTSLDSVATSGPAKGVAIDPVRNLAVVAVGAGGVDVVDLATPGAVAILSTAAIGGDARDVVLDGIFAFVADYSASFTAVDLSDPLFPSVEGSTPQATGGLLQDVALFEDFGFGADVFFVNAVPIVDVTTPATPVPRDVIDFSALRDDNGTGIDADESFVYLTASATTGTENGSSGDTRLYVGQYRAEVDDAGIPPSVTISAPLDGGNVVAGSSTLVTADASDDFGVAAVVFLVDGAIAAIDTTEPFAANVDVPTGASTLTIGAFAVDTGENLGFAADVVVTVDAAPSTTVTGVVRDAGGALAAGATVICNGVVGTTLGDGSFSLDVAVLSAQVQCTATITDGGFARAGTSVAVAPVEGGVSDVGELTAATYAPTLVESGWAIARVIELAAAQGAHFNPVDGLIYAGQDAASGGLFRIDSDGTAVKLHGAANSTGIVVDPDDGDVFMAEGGGGVIYRTGFGETVRSTWVSGFHTGDDDPSGMAVAPGSYSGGVIAAGDALVVDAGVGGPDGLFSFSPDFAEGEVELVGDAGPLVHALDVSIDSSSIYVVDSGDEAFSPNPGVLYRLDPGNVLVPVTTQQPLPEPYGVAHDPQSGDLLVVDAFDGTLVRVDPATGAVDPVATDLSAPSIAGIDASADGNRLAVTDAGHIFVLQRVAVSGMTVQGVVVDAGGNPVNGATVTCRGVTTMSNLDGTFSMADVPALGGISTCSAAFTPADGIPRSGVAGGLVPLPGGTIDIGTLVAATVYEESFQSAVGPEWSSSALQYTPSGRRSFLGLFGNQTVTLSLAGLPAHDQVTVDFELYAVGSWNGNSTSGGPDIWSLVADGSEILRTTFLDPAVAGDQAYPAEYPRSRNAAAAGATAVDVLGYTQSGDPRDMVFHVSLTVAHASPTLTLDFAGFGLGALNDESWGLDNVAVALGPAAAGVVDLDQDGLPDAAEGAIACVSPLRADTDLDGAGDGAEDCDADGLSNETELVNLGSDPTSSDSDGDTIADGEEVVAGGDGFVTDPANADSDLDGVLDQEEIEFGSDPTDAGSVPGAIGALSITDALSIETVSVQNDVDPTLTAAGDPGQLVDGAASGETVSVLNVVDPLETVDPAAVVNDSASSGVVSVDNLTP